MKKVEINNILILVKWAESCTTLKQLEIVDVDLLKRRDKVLKNYKVTSTEGKLLESNFQQVLSAISTTKYLIIYGKEKNYG